MHSSLAGIALVLTVATITGCATAKHYAASGGSKSDGTVKLAYQYGPYERPVVNKQEALELAKSKCMVWGYTDAEAFGAELENCTAFTGYGCTRHTVTAEYQCIGETN